MTNGAMPVTRFARLDRAPPQSQAGDRSQRLVNYGVALFDGRPNGRPYRHGVPPSDLRFTVAPCRSVPSVISDPLLVFTGCSFSTLVVQLARHFCLTYSNAGRQANYEGVNEPPLASDEFVKLRVES
jgi:hypothetical protein